MPVDEQGIGALKYTSEQRKKIALESREFSTEKFGKLVDHEKEIDEQMAKKKVENEIKQEKQEVTTFEMEEKQRELLRKRMAELHDVGEEEAKVEENRMPESIMISQYERDELKTKLRTAFLERISDRKNRMMKLQEEFDKLIDSHKTVLFENFEVIMKEGIEFEQVIQSVEYEEVKEEKEEMEEKTEQLRESQNLDVQRNQGNQEKVRDYWYERDKDEELDDLDQEINWINNKIILIDVMMICGVIAGISYALFGPMNLIDRFNN